MSDPKEQREQSQEDLAESTTEGLKAPGETAKQATGGKLGMFGKLGIFKTTHDKVEAHNENM